MKGDSKLRRSLQFLGGLSPSADGTFDWPLETAGKVLGEACGLDASARALHFLRFMVSAPALDKVGVTLTAAGLFDEVYATLPALQARVQKWLAEEALDSEKEALTLSDTDFFATTDVGVILPSASNAPAQNWALELTWGGDNFGVARETALGSSGEWLSARLAFDMAYVLGKRYTAAHFAAKAEAQTALRTYAKVFGEEANSLHFQNCTGSVQFSGASETTPGGNHSGNRRLSHFLPSPAKSSAINRVETFGSPHSSTSSDEAGGGSRLLRGPGGGVMECSRLGGDETPAAWQR